MKEIWYTWMAQLSTWLASSGIKILVILAGLFILDFFLEHFIIKIIKVSVTKSRHITETAEQKREETLIRIFTWSARMIVILIAVMMVLTEMGIPIAPMLAGAGILGLAVGFGGQYLIRDVITGFFLILENQYRIGDMVSLDETSGLVEDISLRMTTLRDLDGTVHHVPHGDIKRVSNASKDFARINLNLSIAFDVDIDRAIGLINQVGVEFAEDPAWKPYLNTPPQFLRVDNFLEYAVVLKIVGETQPMKQWEATGELRKRIKKAFDKEGIELTVAQRFVQKTAQ